MRRLATLGFVIAAAALTVAAQSTFTITTTSLLTAINGRPYPNVTLQTSGDPGPMGWSIDGPANWTVGPVTATTGAFCYKACSGVIVQETPGQYPLTIVATSQTTGMQAFQNYTLIVENPLQIVTNSLPNANANLAYSTQMQATGGTGNFIWSIQSGTLPPGITLTDNVKGVLAGTAPGINGTYPFTVRLLDQVTQEAVTQALSISVVNGIAILTTSLPNATANQPYSFQLQGTGQNLVWTPGLLPPGFLLDTNGLLTGVGIGTGSFTVSVQLVNSQVPSAVATRTFALLITLGPLSIVESTLPLATQNVAYSTALTPSGGIPPYTWGLGVGGPAGISIGSTSGIVSGTPTTAGSFPLPVTLRDSTGATFTQDYTLIVARGVAITTTSLPNGEPNVPYSATLTAAGGVLTYSWSIVTGVLPPGLSLDPASGKISGTPTALGSFPFTAQVTDFVKGTDTKALTITVGPFLAITTTALPGGALTQPYSQTLTAVNGTPPLTWSIASGALPPGLQLNSTTGAISGTPTAAGNATFDVLVTDAATTTAHKGFTINVANNPVVITSGDFSANVLASVSQTLAASGGTPPYTWSVASGSLPGGLQLNSATGVISGNPSPQGISPVTFTATDSLGLTGSKVITITVIAPPTPGVSINLGATTQPPVSLATSEPYPLEITGFLTLTFAPSANGADGGEARFSDGTRKLFFVVRPNTTQGLFTTISNGTPAILTGTVAGTITLTASMSAGGLDITPSPAPTKTIVIDSNVPVITSVVLQQVTGGIHVVVTGYSNTREVTSGSFTFTVSSGNTLSQATITIPLTSAFGAWFSNAASNATGGQFKLTVPFSVTQGSAMAITGVSVTLTNSKGASGPVSSSP